MNGALARNALSVTDPCFASFGDSWIGATVSIVTVFNTIPWIMVTVCD